MKQRWTALLLALAVALSFGSASVMATGDEETNEAPAAVEAETPAAEPEASPEPSPEPSPAPEPAPTAPVSGLSGALTFGGIDTEMRQNSVSLLILDENIAQIDAMDYESLKNELSGKLIDTLNAQAQMQQLIDGANATIYNLTSAVVNPTNSEEGAMAVAVPSGVLSALVSANAASTLAGLEAQYKAYEDAIDDIKNGSMQADNELIKKQLQSAKEQTILLAETLYVSLVRLESSETALRRSIASLERTVTELELRLELGHISELTLTQTKAGLEKARSGLRTLDMNISNLRMQLELMLGREITGSTRTSGLPEVTDAQLSSMNLEGDLETAKKASYELANAKHTLEEADKTFEDAQEEHKYNTKGYAFQQATHAHTAAEYSYRSSVQSFELRFRTLYAEVKDASQVLAAARASLTAAEAQYEAKNAQFERGMISQNALLAAQDELADARDAVTTARYDLFSSYHEYRTAVESGILS